MLKILSKGYTTLYIDASSEGTIGTIKDRIGNFCSSMSLLDGKESIKCVVLDEMDGASESFFKALRGVMEKYHNVARFIASCNYIGKIPDPVQSRFNCISFDPIDNAEETYIIDEYKIRVSKILTAIKVEHTPEILDKFVRNDFPDMRAIMNKIQSFYLRGVKKLDETNFSINYDYEDLFILCMKGNDKPTENYKFIVSEYSSKIDDALNALGKDFIEYLKNNAPNKENKIPTIIITVAEHQAQRTLVIDPLITLLSCVFKIQMILK
jgi:replication factor C small subunit